MKRLSLLFVLLLLIACNKTNKTKIPVAEVAKKTAVKDSLIIAKEDVAKISYVDYGVDNKAKNTLETWPSYNTIVNALDALKEGDVSFFTKDKTIFDSTLKDLETTIPNAINSEPIKARLLALKTKLYKLEDVINLSTSTKKEQLLAIKETFQAFSYLTLQINKKFEKEAQEIIKPEAL